MPFLTSKLKAFGTATLLLVLFLTACAPQRSPASDSAVPAPADQQVLRTRLTGEPRTLDPQIANSTSESALTKSLFSGLFAYDKDMNIVANLAAVVPTVENGGLSKDGLTYTIGLRKDAKWSDGQKLTADDFVYSFKRLLDPKTAAPRAGDYNNVKGADELSTALGTKASPKTVSEDQLVSLRESVGIRAKDDSTLEYTLDQPQFSFLNIMALPAAFPVRKDVIDKYGSKWIEAGNFVGNGPFVLKEWAHGSRLTLEPNPSWHRESAKLGKLVFNVIEDDSAAYAAYLSNELDIVGVPAANRREIATAGSPLNKELFRGPSGTTQALVMNSKMAPFDNIKVRQAFATAFDRQAYVDVVLSGVGKATTSWIPTGEPGYDPDLGKQFSLNVAKAKQLLTEAGYPDGKGLPKITLLARSTDTDRNTVTPFVIDNFKKNLGIDLDVDYIESTSYISRYINDQFHVTLISWHSQWAWPDNWLPTLLGCNQSNNHTGYCDSKFDEMTKKAAQETDAKKQVAVYAEAHKIAINDAALVPLQEPEIFILIKPRVKGLVITPLDSIAGDSSYSTAYIAAASKAPAASGGSGGADSAY